jgi:hypothetical protein
MKASFSMLRLNHTPRIAALALMTLLTACGGGGNESGPTDSLFLSVSSVKVGSPGNCVTGAGPEVHVYGGTPPYTLSNSVPQGILLNKTVVQNSGESFSVGFINGVCLDKMPITIEDKMGRVAQVQVSNGF